MNKIEITKSDSEGFSALTSFESWQIGVVNYCGRIAYGKKPEKIERHLLTDEAFILTKGRAALYVGREMEKIDMECGMVYKIRKNTWHAVMVDRNAKIFVIENKDTCEKNTEYIYFEN